MPYYSNCDCTAIQVLLKESNELNSAMCSLSYNVFFSLEKKDLFKNLNSLNLC